MNGSTPTRRNIWVQGVLGGVLSGIVFAIAEMVINIFLGKAFLGPLRLISSIVLGREALSPDYPLINAAIVGFIVHIVLSAIFGIVLLYILKAMRQKEVPLARLALYSSIYGFVLWIVNFRIIAPAFFPQFMFVNSLWNGFVAHTFFFGTVLGYYIYMTNKRLEHY